MRYLAGATCPTPSTPPLAKSTSRRNRRQGFPGSWSPSSPTRTIKLCGGSWPSSALSLWFSLHLSRARKGASEAFLDAAPNPKPSTRPPHDEVGEHGDAPGQPAPSDL